MELYLARHGHVDYTNSIDLFAAGLTDLGKEQSRDIAAMAQRLDIRFMVASAMIRAEETADYVSEALPDITRWDLEELQEAVYEDLIYDPTAHPSINHWTDDQVKVGRERTWIRVTAVLPRIEIFMNSYGFDKALIIAHEDVLRMMVLSWQGKDWRAIDECSSIDFGKIAKVTVDGNSAEINVVNVAPDEII